MAAVTLKQADIEAIVAILADESYETPEAMAKAIVKATFEAWRARTWFASVVYTGRRPLVVYGLEATERAAKEAGDGVPFLTSVLRIESLDECKKRWAEYAAEGREKLESIEGSCATCGHRKYEHSAVVPKFVLPTAMARHHRYPCSVRCGCKGFVSKETASAQA